MPTPSILVTGASGRIGKELVHLLSVNGIKPRILLRDNSKAHQFTENVDVCAGDFADRASLIEALKGIDKVFLVCSDHPEQQRLEGNLIDAAVQSNVKHIVKVSVFVAGLNPPISYGVQHAVIEQKLRASGLTWTILRPYMFMQNFLDFASLIASKRMFVLPVGKGEVSLVNTRDVAAVALSVLLDAGHAGKIYEITGPTPLSFKEAAAIFTDVLGQKVRYMSVPSFMAGFAMQRDGVSAWDVSMRLQLFKLLKSGGESQTTDVISQIGKRTPRNFRDFVKDHISYFQ